MRMISVVLIAFLAVIPTAPALAPAIATEYKTYDSEFFKAEYPANWTVLDITNGNPGTSFGDQKWF